jgi:hypothetical protein
MVCEACAEDLGIHYTNMVDKGKKSLEDFMKRKTILHIIPSSILMFEDAAARPGTHYYESLLSAWQKHMLYTYIYICV